MSTTRIQKILIANRGEIARRIIRTCKRLGIASVAVFSDADESMPFVREADEAVRIGPAPSSESYLRADKILEAAKRTGADAIHPGYGFLSENTGFAQACAAVSALLLVPCWKPPLLPPTGSTVVAESRRIAAWPFHARFAAPSEPLVKICVSADVPAVPTLILMVPVSVVPLLVATRFGNSIMVPTRHEPAGSKACNATVSELLMLLLTALRLFRSRRLENGK